MGQTRDERMMSLLDTFLEGQGENADVSKELGPSFAPLPDDTPVTDVADEDQEDAEPLEDTYFTETLARIYLKQRRYDKALEIIRSLYLNFPNKSIYFADQIRYLEKLVLINQK